MNGKRDLLLIAVILILSIILLSDLFKIGLYYSHDGEIHVARLAQFTQALKEKQFPIRWLDHWNFGFGYPTFVFIYSLPYYLGAFLRIFIPDFEVIFKVLMFLSLSFSGLTFYFVAKSYVPIVAAFLGAVFYMAAPYRFADIYERGALGESLAFIFLPLLFIAPKLVIKDKFKGFLFTSLTIFALITTHAITLAIFIAPALIFSFYIFKKGIKKYFPLFFISVIFGFMLASFGWLPMIFEQKYIELDKTYFNIFQDTFITIYQLLRIPKENINIGTGIQLGSAQIIIMLATFFFLIYQAVKKQKIDSKLLFLFISTVIAAFLTTDFSKIIWVKFKPLQTILFPWRFLTLTTFTTAFLASMLFAKLAKSKITFIVIVLFLFLAIFPSRHYLKGHNWLQFSDDYYLNYQDSLKLDNYYLPKGTLKNLDQLQLEQASIIQGVGQIEIAKKKSNQIEANVFLNRNSQIQFHTIYFPGWEIFIDGQKSAIIKDYPNFQGIIIANVSEGNHNVRLEFRETSVRKIGNFLSLVSFLLLFFAFLAKRINDFYQKPNY